MRWDAQRIENLDEATPGLPGMPSVSNLVRSVSTPEFAGLTFHEALAKSALNRVPDAAAVPFSWTVNPYRGCSHACTYCFARRTHSYLELDTGTDFDTQIVDELHDVIESGTPGPRARLALIRAIADAGLPCQVLVAPVLPLLTDSDVQLDALLGRIAQAGATSATVFALHLRPGAREWFWAFLRRHQPSLVQPYQELYGQGSYVLRSYASDLARRAAPLLRRHGLAGPQVLRLPTPPPQAPSRPAQTTLF